MYRVFFVCPLQTLFLTVTACAARPTGAQTSLLTETPQPTSASQNSLLPIPRKDFITRMCYWLWRGGLASSGGQVDHILSLYHTHSEGEAKRFLSSLTRESHFQTFKTYSSSLPPELCQKLKQTVPVEELIESVKTKTPGGYMSDEFSVHSL